ncbi:tRNA pseudouridine(55) synthase TruB [bacterium]|nr:tRNA pseudouridine(55) synthase TruB [bacterium]
MQQEPLFGFLNVYKPKGMTSHDVVSRMRRITKIKQIGHTGTLDPFAEGVLPICIGKSTRLIEYLADDKEYLATVKFGVTTDSYDLDGTIVKTSDVKITEDDVLNALPQFRGEISQLPPIYSAIKVKGKKLYEYARAGEEVKIEARQVFIEKLELVRFSETEQVAEVLVKCSKGTYIRSIAHDLGEVLGCGAHLVKLIRTQAGRFFINNSTNLEEFQGKDVVNMKLINPIEMLDYPKVLVNEDELIKIKNGVAIENKNGIKVNEVVILINNDIIRAVGVADNKKILIKKVF